MPIGKAEDFRGLVDLLSMRAYLWPDGDPVESDVPDEVAGVAQEYRDRLIESIVETDDDLMMRYLEDAEIADADLRKAFFAAVRGGQLTPVLLTSAEQAMGVSMLLDFMTEPACATSRTTPSCPSSRAIRRCWARTNRSARACSRPPSTPTSARSATCASCPAR